MGDGHSLTRKHRRGRACRCMSKLYESCCRDPCALQQMCSIKMTFTYSESERTRCRSEKSSRDARMDSRAARMHSIAATSIMACEAQHDPSFKDV